MHKKVMELLAICTIFTLSKADEINIQILNTDAATPAHIQELNTVFMDSFHAVYIKDWNEKIAQQTKDIFENYIAQFQTDPSMILFIAEKDSQLAGWALFKKLDDENAILEILCISSHYWRQGIGKKLAFAICQTFSSINHISLMTRKINPISPQFYEALGFKKTDFYLPDYKEFENLQGFEWRKYES